MILKGEFKKESKNTGSALIIYVFFFVCGQLKSFAGGCARFVGYHFKEWRPRYILYECHGQCFHILKEN